MKDSVICRENGELKVIFTINTKQSMLKLEEQIESLIESAKDDLSEMEKLQIKQQILQAYINAN
jgi:hypothetical protein